MIYIVVAEFGPNEIDQKSEEKNEDKYKIKWIYLTRSDPNLLDQERSISLLPQVEKDKTTSHSPYKYITMTLYETTST